MELIAVVVALIALFRVLQVERDLREFRRQMSRLDAAPRERPPAAAPQAGDVSRPAAPAGAGSVLPHVPPRSAAPAAPAPMTGHVTPSLPPRTAPPPFEHTASSSEPSSAPEWIERSFGERYLLYAGMVVLVLAVASFLRYAFDQQWLSPAVRVLMGVGAGTALAIGGRVLARAGYRPYGLFLSGGGLVMLFLSVYAAFAFYALIGPSLTFVLLAAIAGTAALLADTESSLPLATLAIIGGFATPLLVGGDTDAQITLFSYVAVLIAVTTYLAYRHRWAWLCLATLVLTILTVVGWAEAHYTDAAWLRTELFLTLYCALFLLMERAGPASDRLVDRAAAAALWTAPAVYHWASIAILSPRPIPFLTYLVLVSGAAIAGSVARRAAPIRLVGWVLVIVPLLTWATTGRAQMWEAAASLAAAGIWVMFAFAIDWVTRRPDAAPGERLPVTDIALLHGSGPALFAVLYVLWSDDWPRLGLAAAAAALAGIHAGVWASVRTLSPRTLHWLGVAATLVAIAVVVGVEGRWVVAMWAAQAAALVWLGVRLDAVWFRAAGLALFGLAAAVWLVWYPDQRIPRVPLLNAHALAAVFAVAMLYVSAWTMRARSAGLDQTWQMQRTVLLLGASLFTVVFLSMEIVAFWRARPATAVDAGLATQLMLSAWWAAYAALLIAAGMRYGYAPIRYFAIGLFALTLLKVFTADVWRLEGAYRVIGLLAVGTILLVASFLYQRARATGDSNAPDSVAGS